MDNELEVIEDTHEALEGHGTGSSCGSATDGEFSGRGRPSSSETASTSHTDPECDVETEIDFTDKENRLDIYFVVMAVLLGMILVGVLLYFSIVTIAESRIEIEIDKISNISSISNFTEY